MEGNAIPFKEFAGIDAFSHYFENYKTNCIDQIRNIAPDFWGIYIEYTDTTRCFDVEDALQDIGIPVMHDNQQGTTIVLLH